MFHIYWKVPEHILCLELEGKLTIDDFAQINEELISYLGDEEFANRITLLIDITRPCSIPQAFALLKASQTFVNRRDIRYLLVAGTDKLNRLMMMLTYNTCRPSLRFFSDVDHALRFASFAK